MSRLEKVETAEGIELQIPERPPTENEKIKNEFIYLIFGLIILYPPMIFITWDPLLAFFLVFPVYGVLRYILKQISWKKNKRSFIIVDVENKRIKDLKGNWIPYTKISEVHLNREYKVKRSTRGIGDNRRTTTSYIANWSIVLHDGETETSILNFREVFGNVEQLLLPHAPRSVDIAEDIADLTGLTLIDATGFDMIQRTHENLDTSLQEVLKKGKIPQFNGVVDPVVAREYKVEQDGRRFIISERGAKYYGLWMFVGCVTALATFFPCLLLYVILIDKGISDLFYTILTLGPFIFIWGSAFYVFANLARSKNTITITPEHVHVNKQGLFRTRNEVQMDLSNLEYIVKFQIDDEIGLELVSDGLRIPIYGKLNPMEVDILHDLMKQILVTV